MRSSLLLIHLLLLSTSPVTAISLDIDSVFQRERSDLTEPNRFNHGVILTGKTVEDESVIAQPTLSDSDNDALTPSSEGEETLTVTLPGNVTLLMRQISAETFIMGSDDDEDGRHNDEGPQRSVSISKPFYLGIYEVTQEQWKAVMGSNPAKFKRTNHPVENVFWQDCQTFISELNEMNQGEFRLPTEAEWEYACRAGTSTRFYWGDDSGYVKIDQYAWHSNNSRDKTHKVGQKKANAWGLFDMSGNVWEWCHDWYQDSYRNLSTEDPVGPDAGSTRVLRGGGWNSYAQSCRSADRNYYSPDYRNENIGFRLLRTCP